MPRPSARTRLAAARPWRTSARAWRPSRRRRPPAPGVPPALNNADVVIDQGHGAHHGRQFAWTVNCNDAQAMVRLVWTVDASKPREARLHLSMLKRSGVSSEDWRILPPTGAPGGHPASWISLGNADFGLIHLLAGHSDDMRRWIGDWNPTQVEADQGYRTIQGVQRGLMELLALGQLAEIRRDLGNKWLFISKTGACLVATQAIGKTYLTVTTFYQAANRIGGGSATYWKRKGGF